MRIEFRRADGGLTRVIVSMNDNLQTWTESGGRGDWPVQGDLKKYVFAIQKAVPVATAPEASTGSITKSTSENLPIGNATTWGGLLLGTYPADTVKEGLYAIGGYARTRLPPFPSLYERAAKGDIAPGWNEIIGRLPDQGTPIKIMEWKREGTELKVLVAVSSNKPRGSSYIWGELPKNLPAGTYHVTLTGQEYEDKDGVLVPAPKTTIRIFYQLECSFSVAQPATAPALTPAERERLDKLIAASSHRKCGR